MNSGEVQARISILHGNLKSAERIYIDGGNPEEAMAMYRQLLQWDDAIRIADTYALDERHHLRWLVQRFLNLNSILSLTFNLISSAGRII